MDKISHIEKLLGKEQWVTWKFQVELALLSAGVMDVVSGIMKRDPKNPGEFDKKDATARFVMGSTVGMDVIVLIRNCDSALEMWNILMSTFENKDEFSRTRLNKEFWGFSMERGETVAHAVARLNDIVAQLANNGIQTTEENKMSRLVTALPHEFDSFCSAWDSTAAAEKTFLNLVQRLRIEEERRGLAEDGSTSEALVSRAGGRKCTCSCGAKGAVARQEVQRRPRPRRDMRDVRCFYCKEAGHIQSQCPNRSKNEALASVEGSYRTARWCLDTGATDHMCPDRSLFVRYRQLEQRKKITLTSEDVIFAVGIGNVEVMAYDGRNWIRRVLEDTLHVPESHYHLMSMSRTLDKGCVMQANSRNCWFKRDGKIVAQGARSGQLFYMKFKNRVEERTRIVRIAVPQEETSSSPEVRSETKRSPRRRSGKSELCDLVDSNVLGHRLRSKKPVGYDEHCASEAGESEFKDDQPASLMTVGDRKEPWNCKKDTTVPEIVGAIPLKQWEIGDQRAVQKNPVMHHGTEHITVGHQYVRELVGEDVLRAVLVGIRDEVIHVVTRALSGPGVRRICEERFKKE